MPRPYNLYFTPDGRTAVVMIEQHDTIRFADADTFRTLKDLTYPGCRGPNHADFSGNGRFFVVTCEFSGELLKVSTLGHRVLGVLRLDPHPTAPARRPDDHGQERAAGRPALTRRHGRSTSPTWAPTSCG